MRVYYAKVTSKFQITIPREVRELLGVKRGDVIAFIVENGKVEVKKARIVINS